METPERILPQVVIMKAFGKKKAIPYLDMMHIVFDKLTYKEFNDGMKFCRDANLIQLCDGIIERVETR